VKHSPTEFNDIYPFCNTCNVVRPPRSSHCKEIGKCVLRYDHYCPYTSNAIGLLNHKYFILLVFYGSIATFMLEFSLMTYFVDYFSDKTESPSWIVWGMFIQNGIFTMSCFLLLVVQVAFLSKNITTKEFYIWIRGQASWSLPDIYNLGLFDNFCQIFGQDIVMWWCPWTGSSTQADGYQWQTRLSV